MQTKKNTVIKNKKNKTVKGVPKKTITNTIKSDIVKIFMETLNLVKLYHWKTRVFSQHKATDDLYERLNENIDKFVEILLGKDASRIQMTHKTLQFHDCKNDTDFKQRLTEFRQLLIHMNRSFDPSDNSDLLNVRDEILGDVNQFLYLMTFDRL